MAPPCSRAIVALTLLLLACRPPAVAAERKESAPRPVRVVTVALTQAPATLSYSGMVHARVLVDLGFRVGGKIIGRPVNVADQVKAGQVLARLDPVDRQLAVEAAESVAAAAEAEAENARTLFARYENLGQRSSAFVPTEFEQRRASMLASIAHLEQAKRQLSMARAQQGYGTLTAEADGVITALPVEVGQVVVAGQTIASLALSNETEIVVDIPENRLGDLRAAESISMSLWAAPDTILKGHLREIGALADPVSRTFAAKISVLNAPPGLLSLGMTATVRVTGPFAPPVAILPGTALAGSQDATTVWVLDETARRASPRKVTVASFNGDGTVSIADGLKPGEKVVTAGADLIDRDLPVTAWEGPVR